MLRYPYEVRSEEEYFDEIQDVKVTKDMLDLARHIVNQKSGRFEPDKFEDHYETALVDLINTKRSGNPSRAAQVYVMVLAATITKGSTRRVTRQMCEILGETVGRPQMKANYTYGRS